MAASNRKSDGIFVRYTFPLYFSYAFWLIGWLILASLLRDTMGSTFPKNSPGLWFDFVFWIAAVVVIGIGGPVSAIKYSISIAVENQQVTVGRCFGLFKKTYNVMDIVQFDISVARKNGVPRATVVFLGGDKISVSAYASGFQEFCNFISEPRGQV